MIWLLSLSAWAADPTWPAAGAALTPPTPAAAEGSWRVYIDPGHGWESNQGNVGALCKREADSVAVVAAHLGDALSKQGPFEVKVGRALGQDRTYTSRVDEAHAWKADVYLCIHNDVRIPGTTWDQTWEKSPGQHCNRRDTAPGFSVLWGDDGDDTALHGRRHALARAVAGAMSQTGWPAYDGGDYKDLYERDAEVGGVFLDRHAPGKRLFVLRRTRIPSIIIETHHALYLEEARRWEEPATLDAFSKAVGTALVRFFTED